MYIRKNDVGKASMLNHDPDGKSRTKGSKTNAFKFEVRRNSFLQVSISKISDLKANHSAVWRDGNHQPAQPAYFPPLPSLGNLLHIAFYGLQVWAFLGGSVELHIQISTHKPAEERAKEPWHNPKQSHLVSFCSLQS